MATHPGLTVAEFEALLAAHPPFGPFRELQWSHNWSHAAEYVPALRRDQAVFRSGYVVYTHEGDWTLSEWGTPPVVLEYPHPRFDTPEAVWLWARMQGFTE